MNLLANGKKSTEHNHIHFHFEWIITRNRYSTSYSLIQCVSNRAFSVYLFGMVQKRKNLAPRVFKSYLKPKNSSISFTNLWKHQKQPLPQLNLCRWPTPPNKTKKEETKPFINPLRLRLCEANVLLELSLNHLMGLDRNDATGLPNILTYKL